MTNPFFSLLKHFALFLSVSLSAQSFSAQKVAKATTATATEVADVKEKIFADSTSLFHEAVKEEDLYLDPKLGNSECQISAFFAALCLSGAVELKKEHYKLLGQLQLYSTSDEHIIPKEFINKVTRKYLTKPVGSQGYKKTDSRWRKEIIFNLHREFLDQDLENEDYVKTSNHQKSPCGHFQNSFLESMNKLAESELFAKAPILLAVHIYKIEDAQRQHKDIVKVEEPAWNYYFHLMPESLASPSSKEGPLWRMIEPTNLVSLPTIHVNVSSNDSFPRRKAQQKLKDIWSLLKFSALIHPKQNERREKGRQKEAISFIGEGKFIKPLHFYFTYNKKVPVSKISSEKFSSIRTKEIISEINRLRDFLFEKISFYNEEEAAKEAVENFNTAAKKIIHNLELSPSFAHQTETLLEFVRNYREAWEKIKIFNEDKERELYKKTKILPELQDKKFLNFFLKKATKRRDMIRKKSHTVMANLDRALEELIARFPTDLNDPNYIHLLDETLRLYKLKAEVATNTSFYSFQKDFHSLTAFEQKSVYNLAQKSEWTLKEILKQSFPIEGLSFALCWSLLPDSVIEEFK